MEWLPLLPHHRIALEFEFDVLKHGILKSHGLKFDIAKLPVFLNKLHFNGSWVLLLIFIDFPDLVNVAAIQHFHGDLRLMNGFASKLNGEVTWLPLHDLWEEFVVRIL